MRMNDFLQLKNYDPNEKYDWELVQSFKTHKECFSDEGITVDKTCPEKCTPGYYEDNTKKEANDLIKNIITDVVKVEIYNNSDWDELPISEPSFTFALPDYKNINEKW